MTSARHRRCDAVPEAVWTAVVIAHIFDSVRYIAEVVREIA
ncbi:hypothetical protein LI90_1706 [Carbonactinospora thermoautotrophica]|uniref:Uncharacterized protein n=1 Tax=Carbonactinospora thermoautotrophica TaxID=1469144 RepID=A0A132MS61_9ACTN|nr:hypothetical protein LI90_1706 [Carbonactinospora thermoautotrophica]